MGTPRPDPAGPDGQRIRYTVAAEEYGELRDRAQGEPVETGDEVEARWTPFAAATEELLLKDEGSLRAGSDDLNGLARRLPGLPTGGQSTFELHRSLSEDRTYQGPVKVQLRVLGAQALTLNEKQQAAFPGPPG